MSKELTILQTQLESRIFTVRGVQVMIDYHLSELYNVETKRINEQVKRNIKRFPESFMFQLSASEWESLQSQIATTEKVSDLRSQIATAKRRTLPYVFTEQGVAMLSAVLNSDTAINVSVQIMNAFVKMRHILLENSLINHRLDKMELKQLETDQKFEQLFKALEDKSLTPKQGIFFDGQIFDAYTFTGDLIRSAKQSLILIDNYIDDTVLPLFTKRKENVSADIFTKNISNQLQLDIDRHNQQYSTINIYRFDKAHDRFLIIDQEEVYHFGASLKDLGKKWFAFSKMDKTSVENILTQIKELI